MTQIFSVLELKVWVLLLTTPLHCFLRHIFCPCWSGMMSALTEWKHGSQLVCEISLEQQRMLMRCSGSSPGSMLCLCVLTSEVLSESTKLSLSRE